MKLTKQKLYQLIQEAIGEKQYGRDFAGFLKTSIRTYMNQDDSLDVGYLEMYIGPELGSGYSRTVFEIDNEHVAKIAYKHEDAFGDAFDEGCKSNRMEYLKFNRYPECFPKSYGIFKNDSVLVVEKVNVISTQDHMDKVIRNCFPVLTHAAIYLKKKGYEKVDPTWVFERVLDTFERNPEPLSLVVPGQVPAEPEPVDRDDEFRKNISWGRTKTIKPDETQGVWKMLSSNSKLMSWVSTLSELDVLFDEIRLGNVGTNKDNNKLILIDISKFDFNSGTEVGQKIPRGAQHSKTPSVPYDNRAKNIETDPDYEKVRTGQWRRINESLRDDHREKLITLLLSNVEGAEQAFDLMRGLELSKQEISALVFPQLPTMLLKSVEYAEFAIELMKGLDMPEEEIFDMIVKILPQVTDIPLRRFLGQQINFYLGRMSGLYDL